MDRDEIGARHRRVQIRHRLVAVAADRLGVHVRVVDQNGGLHRGEPPRRARADLAEADDQDSLAVKIDRHVLVAVMPAAFLDHRVHHRALTRERHRQEDTGLGDADRVRRAADHQRDVSAGQRRDIDCVIADADPRDHFEVRRGIELGIAERLNTEADAARILEHLVKFGLGDCRHELDALDIVARLDQRPAGFRHRRRHHDLLAIDSRALGHELSPSQ